MSYGEGTYTLVTVFCLNSINGDGAAQPVPTSEEQHQEETSQDEADEAGRVSWPAPFEMPSSLSEEASASNQVNIANVIIDASEVFL